MTLSRRHFLQTSAATCLAAGGVPQVFAKEDPPLFQISVAEYSLHRIFANNELDNLDFPKFCQETFGVDAVEHWMGPYQDQGGNTKYFDELKQRASDAGVRSLLIMVDREGNLGAKDSDQRQQAVANHHKWVEHAKAIGCHSIRVNAASEGSYEEQLKLAADGLRQLSEFAATHDINVIVENHGGLSSNGAWLAAVMRRVDLPNCGTLPDFGNFNLGDGKQYDRYRGVQELMPFAKAVSAKSHEFDAQGNEVQTDYFRMMKIVLDAGYRGYVGIEWEGSEPASEVEGVKLTQRLLERVREKLSAAGTRAPA